MFIHRLFSLHKWEEVDRKKVQYKYLGLLKDEAILIEWRCFVCNEIRIEELGGGGEARESITSSFLYDRTFTRWEAGR